MEKKNKITILIFFAAIVLLTINNCGGYESIYYVQSHNLYINLCLSPVSNYYYLFFRKGDDTDELSGNWIKCKNYGRNQFLLLQINAIIPDSAYINQPGNGFQKGQAILHSISIQGDVESITKTHSESLRLSLMDPIESRRLPREFPEFSIGNFPVYNNPEFTLLMYDDKIPDGEHNIIKLTPERRRGLAKSRWIIKASKWGLIKENEI